jgi:hypothetical protein
MINPSNNVDYLQHILADIFTIFATAVKAVAPNFIDRVSHFETAITWMHKVN